MSKYIKYKRIHETFNTQQLKDKFDDIVEEGLEILFYNERVLDTPPNDRILVTMVVGKLNVGKELLNG